MKNSMEIFGLEEVRGDFDELMNANWNDDLPRNVQYFLKVFIQAEGRLQAVRWMTTYFGCTVQQAVQHIDRTPELNNAYVDYKASRQAEFIIRGVMARAHLRANEEHDDETE